MSSEIVVNLFCKSIEANTLCRFRGAIGKKLYEVKAEGVAQGDKLAQRNCVEDLLVIVFEIEVPFPRDPEQRRHLVDRLPRPLTSFTYTFRVVGLSHAGPPRAYLPETSACPVLFFSRRRRGTSAGCFCSSALTTTTGATTIQHSGHRIHARIIMPTPTGTTHGGIFGTGIDGGSGSIFNGSFAGSGAGCGAGLGHGSLSHCPFFGFSCPGRGLILSGGYLFGFPLSS